FRIPTLYIPLPLANYDEQTKNAQAIVDQNGALLMNQKDLSPETLLKQLQILYNDRDKFRTAFGKKPYLETAAPKLADLVIQVLAEKYRVQKNSSNN
ncbi:MAG: hypothetical protein LBG64_01490, partial [Pseudomonadales bacterium]|nr:hypothetical protein [Pseudomonadales bacterium]